MKKIFVGFGFGPIQSALFLLEAYRSGNFDRFIVAEVDQALCDAVRANSGRYTINITHADRIEAVTVEGVELNNPLIRYDYDRLVSWISWADEAATALPSVASYAKGVAPLLAEGILRREAHTPLIIYAAENHNRAAEALAAAMQGVLKRRLQRHEVQIINTVIGKMGGVIMDRSTIDRLGLETLTPDTERAILVEAFNRILISHVTPPAAMCGIPCFVEKPDLLPFEEAKLYGHNAIHAVIGYLAQERSLVTMDQAAKHADVMATARAAFLDESGAALCRKYAALGDPLFTTEGFRAYAEDLLTRITNPYLNDLVARVVRDPQRKLAWDDRLYGTMRLALSQGVTPRNLARGAAAAVRFLHGQQPLPDREAISRILHAVWSPVAEGVAEQLIDLTWEAMR